MGRWWPLGTFSVSAMTGETAKSVRVEANVGGLIVEIGHDGTEHLWGTITSYDPHDSISMDFHIDPQSTRHPGDSVSLVEVRFTALGDERTQVVLTQSDWEAFGDQAEMLRGGYGQGWTVIFEQAFKAACGG